MYINIKINLTTLIFSCFDLYFLSTKALKTDADGKVSSLSKINSGEKPSRLDWSNLGHAL